jgi:menaquinone-dependent protoporphyrinogen IX oxidase
MKRAVVYQSKTGYTKKVAEWIALALSADLLPLSSISASDLLGYDLLIYGGGLYAGGINGLKCFNAVISGVDGAQIVYFATGATPKRENVVPELIQHNFHQDEGAVPLFYVRGGFNYTALGLMDKVLMIILKLKIKSKKEADRSPDERGMLAAFSRTVDFTNSNDIEPIVKYATERGFL